MSTLPRSNTPVHQQNLSEVDSTRINPSVRFAKFENGRLKYIRAHTKELSFIAISHVWGADTQWCEVNCLDFTIQASARKVEFINERLPELVGGAPFWMDILTINQTDKDEKIATIKAIPAIFRDAEKTIAVKENDGIYGCCICLAEKLQTGSALSQLQEHVAESHANYVCEESYLQRLWTLQEILLSGTVQFVPINDRPPQICQGEIINPHRSQATAQRIAWALDYLDTAFRDSVIPAAEILTKAYLSNGIAKWPRRQPTEHEDIFSGHFVTMFRTSPRATTRVRDYFLATMTRFDWYHVPVSVAKMGFNDLFLDLYEQSWRAGHGFGPKILASMTTGKDFSGDPNKAWGPSPDQPIPCCLGDFLKLIGWKQTVHQYHFVTEAFVTPVCTNSSQYDGEILGLIESSMRVAETAWNGSRSSGEFDKHGSSPEDWASADVSEVKEPNATPTEISGRFHARQRRK
ncbi:uncharacterized protein K452DRAFT_323020 [Aplosporella prunicola CBS 121167]|uniref:Heterokaryon incompatibility domain-containing protein n=1 Tax=Aplosporella prunicola CBS 121167 TaxID=1176127 RepID=A0A6A6AX06_9PEZI|nr:uncharacterized protein K452DRAFT_323020 [Aplosporella prunicola CBS 121167]KAF2135515.1 hypothetical protein K452DRAFT_323020 [Aplosporella prunicola CBS 121167]